MRNYKCLSRQIFENESYQLVPLRDEDKYLIRQWRNEQIYHLRQSKPLTLEAQEAYFSTVVSSLFEQNQPSQLLFSFLKDGQLVAYGGLVHINWVDKYAEISFLMNTSLEKDYFEEFWLNYLQLIEKVGFSEANFHKLFTYAFDVRPHLYPVLEKAGFPLEARLKEHCFFDGRFIDVLIHSKLNRTLSFRKAIGSDVDLYFEWANDEGTRQNSFNSDPIPYDKHVDWFVKKIQAPNSLMLVFENHLKQPVGQVRIDKNDDESVIGISIANHFRGNGFATSMIAQSIQAFFETFETESSVIAYIKLANLASKKAFERAGFHELESTADYYKLQTNRQP
ncbi:RimJ/RimL family protein N-acetyltransferase [Runella defluvii]|uniref:RimJ/RimL family protein N-acetyltransferase n=1 Tax=Runella defluvii TaxID=370973 RepID=A0A7W6EP97_9BACT|nr:GNAT family N-acetyltransferase [Runella defluvii]MBB3837360.1 RimJ/RimL family protein N-acetyltransferase [Runella defluvii]